MKWKLGTRGSSLAIAQSKEVKRRLEEAYPDISIDLVIIKTTGDQHPQRSLSKMLDKGIFVKEIEDALRKGSIDLAVHSMKDMPSEIDEELCFCETILREDARDVLVLKEANSLQELKQGARIATGSLRRGLQLKALRNDIELCDIRGNVETRLAKMNTHDFDGVVLAAAGLHRLQLQKRITMYFDETDMIPACAQGALAIEIRKDRHDLYEKLHALQDVAQHQEVEMERAILSAVHAGCHTPFGVRVHIVDKTMEVLAMLAKADGSYQRIHTFVDMANRLQAIENIASYLLQEDVQDCL